MSWRHHYVPQFYLKKWATNKKIYQHHWEPRSNCVVTRMPSIRSTAFIPNMYTLYAEPIGNKDAEALEKSLSKFETQIAPILDVLINSGVKSLKADSKAIFATFILQLVERGPERLAKRDQAAIASLTETISRVPQHWITPPIKELLTKEFAINSARGSLVRPDQSTSEWADGLIDWNWDILSLSKGFITTDKPVLLNLPNVDWGDDVYIIGIALSHDKLLVCTQKSWREEVNIDWLKDYTAVFNCNLINNLPRFIYTAIPLNKVPYVNLEKAISSVYKDQ